MIRTGIRETHLPRTLHHATFGRLKLALVACLAASLAVLTPRPGLAQAVSVTPQTQAERPDGLILAVPNGIVVYGEAEAEVPPDLAVITLGVQTEGKTASQASARNATTLAVVVDALWRAGVPAGNMGASGLSLAAVRAQPKPDDLGPPAVLGYRAVNALHVTVDDVARVGELLDLAIDAGANASSGIQYTLRDESGLRRQVLDQAMWTARAKAETLAAAAGGRITSVQSVVEEIVAGQGAGALAGVAAAVLTPAAPMHAGEVSLRARVRVVYTYATV